MRPPVLPKPTNLDEGQGIRGPDMWVDEAIWGHRLYDEETPWLAFLEFLNVLGSEDHDSRAFQGSRWSQHAGVSPAPVSLSAQHPVQQSAATRLLARSAGRRHTVDRVGGIHRQERRRPPRPAQLPLRPEPLCELRGLHPGRPFAAHHGDRGTEQQAVDVEIRLSLRAGWRSMKT